MTAHETGPTTGSGGEIMELDRSQIRALVKKNFDEANAVRAAGGNDRHCLLEQHDELRRLTAGHSPEDIKTFYRIHGEESDALYAFETEKLKNEEEESKAEVRRLNSQTAAHLAEASRLDAIRENLVDARQRKNIAEKNFFDSVGKAVGSVLGVIVAIVVFIWFVISKTSH